MRASGRFVDVGVEGNVHTLIGAVERKRTVHAIFVVGMIGAEHDHAIAELQLCVNDLSGLLSNEVALKQKRLFKPIDRRLWISFRWRGFGQGVRNVYICAQMTET